MSRTVKRWLAELAEPPSRGPGKGGVMRKKPAEVNGNLGKSEKPKKPPAGKPPWAWDYGRNERKAPFKTGR